MPPAPKPTRAPKGKKRQRVYVRYEDGSCELCFRSEIGENAEKVYALGTKYIGEHAALVGLLDTLASNIVRRRDGYKCVICGGEEKPQCGHVFVRGKWGIRWDLDNLNCICGTCNYKDTLPAYSHVYKDWYRWKFGEDKYIRLRARAEAQTQGKDWTVSELRILLERMEELYDRLCSMSLHDEAMMKEIGLYG